MEKTDENGVLTDAELERVVPGRERNDLMVLYHRATRAMHDHDVAVVKGIGGDSTPMPGDSDFIMGAYTMKENILVALKAGESVSVESWVAKEADG